MPEGCSAIQRDLRWMENGLRVTLCSLARGSTKSCSWAGATPGSSTCWGTTSKKAALQTRIWRSWWTPGWPWTRNLFLWPRWLMVFPELHWKDYLWPSGQGRWSFPLLSTGEATTGVFQLWVLQQKRDIDILDQVQRWATKIMEGLEHLTYWLRDLVLFSLENRRLRGAAPMYTEKNKKTEKKRSKKYSFLKEGKKEYSDLLATTFLCS